MRESANQRSHEATFLKGVAESPATGAKSLPVPPKPVVGPIAKPPAGVAWGSRVSDLFKTKVSAICKNLGCSDNDLMATIAVESGETFAATNRSSDNKSIGLLRFSAVSASAMGTTVAELATLSAEDQLDYVEKHLRRYKGSDLAPKFYPVVSSYLAFGLPIWAG
jgi:hypothetical protein